MLNIDFMKYFYPDVDDKLIVSDIKQKEPFPGYWNRSENFALSGIISFLKEHPQQRFIDVGAGEGRLTIAFTPFFREIIFLEPDILRLEKAKNNFFRAGIKNIQIKQTTLQNSGIESNSCDLILISHVIQHVETSTLSEIFSMAYKILKKDGKIIVTTSHSRRINDYYSKVSMKAGKIKSKIISENDFNNLVMNEDGVLPVHNFTIKSLKNYLSNFVIEKTLVFHEMFPKTVFDKWFNRDEIINWPFFRHITGRDVYVLARKN